MAGIKSLAKDTAIYGMSSIVGRFLNWCLVPIYTRVLTNAADYGVVNYLYGLTAFVLVFLTYGMETGFFRFANKEGSDPKKVYSTTLLSIGATTLLFFLLGFAFLEPISVALKSENHPDFILMMLAIVSMDAFASIPFVYLRFQNKAVRFAVLKMVFVAINIGLNLFFLKGCPSLYTNYPEWISWFYTPGNEVGLILWANVISTAIVTLLQLPDIVQAKWAFDWQLWRKMLAYSLPLLILGLAGIISQTVDKIVYPFVIPDRQEAMYQLGIYGANFKIAVVLVMFTQAFRFAYEPFIFSQTKDSTDKRQSYSDAMKYFIIISLIIFLGIMCYMDILKFIIGKEYHEGLRVVPIVMIAQLLFGIYFNLSLWYKLSDKTTYGAYFSTIGCVMTIGLNIWYVPIYGYMASAWASLVSYFVITVLSYIIGQKHYRINYDLRSIGIYFLLFALLFVATYCSASIESLTIRLIVRTIIFSSFVAYSIKKELSPTQIKSVITRVKTII